jgi:hypothetical protein
MSHFLTFVFVSLMKRTSSNAPINWQILFDNGDRELSPDEQIKCDVFRNRRTLRSEIFGVEPMQPHTTGFEKVTVWT